jgi:serine/threonine protein kinase
VKSERQGPPLEAGLSWGRFELSECIGEGAFGRVYRAWDPKLRRQVALKITPAGTMGLEEAYALAQIDHENVVRVFDVESVHGETGIAMQLLRGETLEQHIQREGRLPAWRVAQLGQDICRAVAILHKNELLHRDIKPQNVMLCENGRPVLMDLGLSASAGENPARSKLAGTLPFIAPELFAGDAASASTDIYAVGVTLYYALSGKYPISATDYEGFRRAHLVGARQRLSSHVSRPRRLVAAIEKAVDSSPEKRSRTADEFRDALQLAAGRPRVLRLLVPVALGIFLALAWFAVEGLSPPRNYRVSRVTSGAGLDTGAALSKDGRLLAYASDNGGKPVLQLYVRDLLSGVTRRITDTSVEETDPSFSPDGQYIAFRSERNGGGIYRLHVDGSGEQSLVQGGANPQYSPDGKWILYWVKQPGTMDEEGRSFRIPAAGGSPMPIAPAFRDVRYPVWTPDGKILFQGNRSQAGRFTSELWIADSEGRETRSTRVFETFRKAKVEPFLGPVRVFDGRVVLAAGLTDWSSIWDAELDPRWPVLARAPRRLTTGAAREILPSVSLNGRIAFESLLIRQKIFRVRLDGSSPGIDGAENLTGSADYELLPSVSADGAMIAYRKITHEDPQIWLRDLRDPRQPARQVTQGADPKSFPVVDPAGRAVAYAAGVAPTDSIGVYRDEQVHTVCRRCGRPVQWLSGTTILSLAEDGSELLSIDSRTGSVARWFKPQRDRIVDAGLRNGTPIAAISMQEALRDTHIQIMDMSDPLQPRQLARLSTESGWLDRPRWAADGSALFYVSNRDGNLCIWKQRFDSRVRPVGEPAPVVHLHTAHLSMSRSSRSTINIAVDRQWLYFSATELEGNIWLMEPGK